MIRPLPRACLLLALCALSPLAYAAPADNWLNADQVRTLLTNQGYTRITDLDLDDGVWEADATNAQGVRVDVHVDPRDGRIISDAVPMMLGASEIRDKLAAAGYKRVRDLEFDDGVWKAEARRPHGRPVELILDARSGKILHVDDDRFD